MAREVTLTRVYHFSAAHELVNPALSREANAALYGPCHRPHGHNYYLEVSVAGVPDPVTGMAVDLAALDERVEQLVLEQVDHHKLEEAPALAGVISTGEGLAGLRERLAQGVSLVVGHSGVGKSSLINGVCPGLGLRVGEVTDYHGRGRHTTTSARLVALPGTAGWVVDSPGLREFSLDDIVPADLARLFPGFGELPDGCRFSDCRHRAEPGCAVIAAVQAKQSWTDFTR